MKRLTFLIGAFIMLVCITNGMGLSQTMAAENSKKKALIVVDPGFSKYSQRIAEQISKGLKTKGYSVDLVTVSQFQADKLSKADLVVLGGPTYAGKPAGGLQKAVSLMKDCKDLNALLFITGGSDYTRGLQELQNLATKQGMKMLGACGFLTKSQENQLVADKIDQLLENVQ